MLVRRTPTLRQGCLRVGQRNVNLTLVLCDSISRDSSGVSRIWKVLFRMHFTSHLLTEPWE